MPVLSERTEQILRHLVTDYITTASPVGSGALTEQHGLNVSAATVRNEMVKLEEDGFIHRPHASAGGVPSDKGYRFFVESLPPQAVPPGEARETLEIEIASVRREVEEWARTISSAVAELIGTVAFATPPRLSTFRVKQLELIHLHDTSALLVLILHGASVHKLLIPIAAPRPPEYLEHTRNRVASVVADRTAGEIEANIPRGMDALETDVIDSTLGVLRSEETRSTPRYEWRGLSELLAQPEFADSGQGREIVDVLEGGETLSAVVSEAPTDGSVGVYIGSEMGLGRMQAFSVIVCRYGRPGEPVGTVGLIGPTRLHYSLAMPVVSHAASLLGRLSAEVAPEGVA